MFGRQTGIVVGMSLILEFRREQRRGALIISNWIYSLYSSL